MEVDTQIQNDFITLKDKFTFNVNFFNCSKDKLKAIEKNIPFHIIEIIHEYYDYHYVNNHKYTYIDYPLRENIFQNNFKEDEHSQWDYSYVSKIEYKDLCLILDFCELFGTESLEELISARIAHFYRGLSYEDANERLFLYCSTLNDDDIGSIFENDPIIKEFYSRIKI